LLLLSRVKIKTPTHPTAMNHSQRVVLCGNSLLIAVIAEGLQKAPGFEVECVDPAQPNPLAQIAAIQPDVVLVERNEGGGNAQMVLNLLHDHPELTVIELDAQTSLLTVLSSQQSPAGSLADLVLLIENSGQIQERPGRKNKSIRDPCP